MHATLAAAGRRVIVRPIMGTPQHPLKMAPPTGEAFKLVREILRERPKHFHEIVHDGIKAFAVPGAKVESEAGPSTEAAPLSKKKGQSNAARRGQKAVVPFPPRKDGAEIPEGHPFVSGTYLKKRILTILDAQHLVKKEWHQALPGTALYKQVKLKPQSMFALNEDASAEKRWEALTQPNLRPSQIKHIGLGFAEERRQASKAKKERLQDAGVLPRTEREIWAWAERPKGRTTNLERLHLNSRRRKARDGKEERAAALEDEREAARRAAAEVVGQQ